MFLSWSGDRSRLVAEAFDTFLKKVIQAAKPWISTGMNKGAKWDEEISESLEESKAGIICLTSDNVTAPWLLFEAGAIAKATEPRVYTFLLDIKPTDVKPPLASFQHTLFEKTDVRKLVRTINKAVTETGGNAVDENALEELFDDTWTKLETALNVAKSTQAPTKPTKRSLEELVPEILETVRSIDRKVGTSQMSFQPATVGQVGAVSGNPIQRFLVATKCRSFPHRGRYPCL